MPNLNGCLKLAWVSQNANCVNDMVTVTLWTTNAYFSRSRILVQMKRVSIYVKTGNSLISYSHVNHLKLTRCSIEWKCWLSDLPARFVIVIVDSNLNVVIKKGISHVINIYLSCLCFINFRRPKQLFLLILEDIKQLKLWFSTGREFCENGTLTMTRNAQFYIRLSSLTFSKRISRTQFRTRLFLLDTFACDQHRISLKNKIWVKHFMLLICLII